MKKYILVLFILGLALSANIAMAGTNCGPADGQEITTLSSSSSGLCSSGRALLFRSVYSGSSVSGWKWLCYGGSSSFSTGWCSATKLTSGTSTVEGSATYGSTISKYCGSSTNKTFSSAPTTNLCNAGTASAVSTNSATYAWSCKLGNLTLATCSAYRTVIINPAVNGACSSSNNQSFDSAPTSNLCFSGTASAVSGIGPWTWTCIGSNGGSNASCSASKIIKNDVINGVCGYEFGEILSSTPTSNLCKSGNASAVSGTGPWTWTCSGIGGTSDSCLVNKAKPTNYCGSAVYGYFYTFPSEYLCSGGETATKLSTTKYPNTLTWYCNQGKAECGAKAVIDGQCGSSNGKSFGDILLIDNLCAVGSASTVSESDNSYTWACSGINYGKTTACSAKKSQTAVNGACGSVANQKFFSAPNSNLCSSGIASQVLTSSTTFDWTCAGVNGGITASCSAIIKIHQNTVALIVDSNTYNALSGELARFESDVERDTDYNVSILNDNWGSASKVRDRLVSLYENEGLSGAILIGNIPIVYQITEYEGTRYPKTPSDYFYQKIDGKDWFEETVDTIVQTAEQKNNYSRSIWTSRLMAPTSNSFDEGISLLRKYFDRNHAYRIGQFSYDKKLLLIESQTQSLLDGNDISQELYDFASKISGYTGLYSDSNSVEVAYALDHEERKKAILEKNEGNYEAMVINIHGSPRSQWVGGSSWIGKDDLLKNNPGSLYIQLDSCSNGDMRDANYIAGWYLFSGQSLLVKANSVVTFYIGGPFNLNRFSDFQKIASGSNFGDIYKVDNSGDQVFLFGDPTLKLR